MKAEVVVGGRTVRVDLSAGFDISIGVDPHSERQVRAFSLPPARSVAFEAGGGEGPRYVGDTRRGGSVNCEVLTLCPHGNGTHTECVGHLTKERIAVPAAVHEPLVPATLLTVEVDTFARSGDGYPGPHEPDERVVSRAALERALGALGGPSPGFVRALVLRTAPNPPEKRWFDYSGTWPPYLSAEAARWVAELGVEHLLVDLPSLDREHDGGGLSNHRCFWGLSADGHLAPPEARGKTVTELVYVDDVILDGLYLVNLQLPSLFLDAAPSRPLLFPVDVGGAALAPPPGWAPPGRRRSRERAEPAAARRRARARGPSFGR
jgi:arylformamidase